MGEIVSLQLIRLSVRATLWLTARLGSSDAAGAGSTTSISIFVARAARESGIPMAECFIYLKSGFSLVADTSSVVSVILVD